MTKSAFEKGLYKEQDKIALTTFYFFLSEKCVCVSGTTNDFKIGFYKMARSVSREVSVCFLYNRWHCGHQ